MASQGRGRAWSRTVVEPGPDSDREMLSEAKGALRSAAARTTQALTEAVGQALNDVLLHDILGWFQSRASYAMQS
jgi:hypothetical protein